MNTTSSRLGEIGKIQAIFEALFGKQLDVQFLVDTDRPEWRGNEPFLRGTDLLLPLRSTNRFLGVAKIKDARGVPSDVVTLMVKSLRQELIPALEDRQTVKGSSSPIAGMGGRGFLHSVSEEPVRLFVFQSQSPSLIRRTSLQLHDLSGRWAHFEFRDIGGEFTSVADLKALGACSLLVPDHFLLAPKDQEVLADFLREADLSLHPRVVIGSHRDWRTVATEGVLHEGLIAASKGQIAELDRWPTNSQLFLETLKLFSEPGIRSL